jgi:acetyl-CoA hydrolase/succinyl-CoA:acetate CoA-transferase
VHKTLKDKITTADEAAALVQNGDVIGASGFTQAAYPKVVPPAIARRARRFHERGEPFQVVLFTGASTGDELDGELARAQAISRRYPYQSHPDMRHAINSGDVAFADLHLSHVSHYVRCGFLPRPTVAIVDAVDVTPDGKIYLSTSGGSTATYLQMADRIIIELNRHFGPALGAFHDTFTPAPPPRCSNIPIYSVLDRVGEPFVQVDPNKIAAIVECDLPDSTSPFKPLNDVSRAIAANIVDFIKHEQKMGRMPKGLPYQSGVGNVANAVLTALSQDPDMSPFSLYTEVIQDALFSIIDNDKLVAASCTAMLFSPEGQSRLHREMPALKEKVIIRQQEISNHPEVVRRLGVVSMNTALEFDIFGNVNSTHVMGAKMMNGVGGSGDFTQNCYLPIFMAPSTVRDHTISTLVPMVTHTDHSEHATKIFVTDQGLADVRGMSPVARARHIIQKCAHPLYRDLLTDYLEYGLRHAPAKHTPHVLGKAFDFHLRLQKDGSMLPK